eukprot:RCo016023
MLFLLSLVLVLSTGMLEGTVIRLATVLTTPLQPFSSSGEACNNITGCVGGFPIVSAFLRDSASTHSQTTVWWIDTSSKLVEFHPLGLAFNLEAWRRASNIGLCGWAYDNPGLLALHPESLNPLFESRSVPPIASNVHLDQDSPFYNLFQRQIVVPPSAATGGLTLGIVAIQDWTKTAYPTFYVTETLPVTLSQLRELHGTDMNILLLATPLVPDWRVLLALDVDVLVTGFSFNTTLFYPPPPQYINGTGVAIRSNLQNSVSFIDIDLDLWRAKQSFLTFTEIDVSQPVNFSITPINDATYYSDLEWMQAQLMAAAANDVTVGYCSSAVPAGDGRPQTRIVPCRYQECAIGTWWAQILLAYTSADVALINGGSFSAGWPAGAVNLTNIWGSYPYTDSICTFQVYGIHLYDIIVYSVSKGAPTISYLRNTGPFAQLYNLRVTYNPQLNGTRVTAIEVYDKNTGTWGPLKRARVYTVATTTYICGGGDDYGKYITFAPGTSPLETSYEVHGVALEIVNKRGSLECPTLRGTLTVTSSTTPLVMEHQTQASCTVNTYWVSEELACLPCPTGTFNTASGLEECFPVPPSSSTGLTLPLVVGLGGGCLLVVFLVASSALYLRRQAAERRVLAMAPTGTIAIVFTDIQGSTQLWDQHPEEMSAALELHNRAIREELATFGGYEVKTIGDSFMIAFPNALDAVACCVNIQLSLLTLEWPDAILQTETGLAITNEDGTLLWRGLRVRMGVQVGEPEVVVDHSTSRVDYFGPMVNQAARVESRAHGGEICLTQEVMNMIGRARYTDDWVITALGEQSFKGVSEKIPLYSLHHQSLTGRTYPPSKPLACDRCQEPLECPRCDVAYKHYDSLLSSRRPPAAVGLARPSMMTKRSSMAARSVVSTAFARQCSSQVGSDNSRRFERDNFSSSQ